MNKISSINAISQISLEPTFSSFDGAVLAVTRHPRSQRAREDNFTLKSVSVVDYRLGGDLLELQLSDGRMLRLSANGGVDWAIEVGDFRLESKTIYEDEVEVTLETGTRYKWHPHVLLESLSRANSIVISVSVTFVFLYARGCPDIMVTSMLDRDRDSAFLSIDEE